MQKGPPTPKGFRDILPETAALRRKTINTIALVLEDHGFVPLETPTIEFSETLTGKYGEEEKLIYKFEDRGGRDLALRYDLTVPLARFTANNQNLLSPTFSRYQIGQVFRGENPQAGRYREFTQFDFDTVGSTNLEDDAKIIAAALIAIRKLGFKEAAIFINDRANFQRIPYDIVRAMDKLHKIGRDGVIQELKDKYKDQKVQEFLEKIESSKPSDNLKNITEILEKNYNLENGQDFIFDPTLARGLDYYTGCIFEMKPKKDPEDLTIGSGGRYDNLIGTFAGKSIPAVGFSFGIDRIVDILSK